jgi:hypothetical protein
MTIACEGDSLRYLRPRRLHATRCIVQCIAEERSEEVASRGAFSKRDDSFKQDLKNGVLHKCEFAPVRPGARQIRLNEVLRLDRHLSPILFTVARFLATANISMEATTQGGPRDPLLQAYDLDRENGEAPDESMKCLSLEDAGRRVTPNLTVGNCCQALEENHTQTKRAFPDIFRCDMFVGSSIDEVTIPSCKFLNFDVINPISSVAPFTDDFLDRSSMTTSDFVVALLNMLH